MRVGVLGSGSSSADGERWLRSWEGGRALPRSRRPLRSPALAAGGCAGGGGAVPQCLPGDGLPNGCCFVSSSLLICLPQRAKAGGNILIWVFFFRVMISHTQ